MERGDETTLSTSDLAAAGTQPATEEAVAEGRPEPDEAELAEAEAHEPLLAPDEADQFRSTWFEIQTRFVDEPRRSVEEADRLVADLMQRLATMFSQERASLESQWDRGDDVSTEDLRISLTRYRSFFERLLSA